MSEEAAKKEAEELVTKLAAADIGDGDDEDQIVDPFTVKAGAKGVKTTNFDACRDLNGRRLRYVNQEAKLREWEAQAEERKRKKEAEQTGSAPLSSLSFGRLSLRITKLFCSDLHS